MSQIIFNNYIDMSGIAATPSSIGYTVGYDLDGVLKQKDQNGVVTPIGKSSTQRLDETLKYGNQTGTHSIIMGTATSIGTNNKQASTRIYMDYGSGNILRLSATASNTNTIQEISPEKIFLSATYSTKKTTLQISSSTFSLYSGTTTYSTFIEQTDGNRLTIGHYDANIGSGGKISVIDTGRTYDGAGSDNKAYVHINSKGATTSIGVQNSVVIGGSGLTASSSNTVYLGNSVNINNAYVLPSIDGLYNQILTTDGGGTVSWATFSVGAIPLKTVLAEGNTSGTYSIIMEGDSHITLGTNSLINSSETDFEIQMDYLKTDNKYYISIMGSKLGSILDNGILVGTESIILDTKGELDIIVDGEATITSGDQRGLVYDTDYSATFVDNSLITKRYLIDNSGFYYVNNTAFVDPLYGDDLTGTLNKPNMPFSTIASAMIGLTASTWTNTSRARIYLRKGTYTQVARMENYIDYYCEPGVVFTENGFRDYSGINTNIYGHASFIGGDSSLIPLISLHTSNIEMEFDEINSDQAIARLAGLTSSVNMRGRKMKSISNAGYGISVEGSTNLGIYVDENILGAYETIYAQDNFSGSLHIETPKLYSNGTIAISGVASGQVHALRVGNNVTGNIKVKADIEEISSTTLGNNSAVLISSGNVHIDGDIKGNSSYGVYVASGSSGNLSINGDISSTKEAIYDVNDSVMVKISNSFIKSDGLGTFTQSIYMGSSGNMYISNSTLYNGLTNSSVINATIEQSTIGVYNSLAYSPGTASNFILCTHSGYTMGFHNVRSNMDNSDNIVDLFNPSGFIYDQNLFIPEF
jgi:hypothetical protein